MNFADLLDKIVKPLFPRLRIEEAALPKRDHGRLVTTKGPTGLRVKEKQNSQTTWLLKWNDKFQPCDRLLVENLITAYLEVKEKAPGFVDQLQEVILRAGISATVAGDEIPQSAVESAIEKFTTWSSQTYEGDRVAAGLVLLPNLSLKRQIKIDEILAEDFAKTLTDGVTAWWEVGRDLYIRSLCVDTGDLTISGSANFLPERYSALASSIGEGVGLVLNRQGEILIFADGLLRFAKRRGLWMHFPHSACVKQLAGGGGKQLARVREAIYESCLDASFARSGGCIGLIQKKGLSRLEKIIPPADLLSNPQNEKARFAHNVIGRKKFFDLPRKLRKQLLRLDGAMILLWDGTIFACGSLIEIGDVERGNHGGRSAAAKKLSESGLGIKISEDGLITAYRNGSETLKIG